MGWLKWGHNPKHLRHPIAFKDVTSYGRMPCEKLSIGLFSTNWKHFRHEFYHLNVGFLKFDGFIQQWFFFFSFVMVVINEGQQLVYTHASIYSNLIFFNDYKYMYHVWMTLCPIYQFQAETGNNVSEFLYSNWITPSYYLSSKHKESSS